MAIVKKCLDANCTDYILLDNGRLIEHPKTKCDKKELPENFTEELEGMFMEAKETTYVNRGGLDMKNVVVGEEFSLDKKPKLTKQDEIKTLEKRLKELRG